MAAADSSSRHRVALAVFVLLLVTLAFARAHYASSTGIRIAGDGADYQTIAAGMKLEGRAPFVYRPAVPLLVGALFPGNLTLGFAVVCAVAMFLALFTVGSLAHDHLAGYGVVAVLFLNYQVLFAAANPARLDIVVLAVQLGFVGLALRRNSSLYFVLLPLCALLKESMLLSLGALALIAFPRDRGALLKAGASGAVFVTLHLIVRTASSPTAAVPPYTDGVLSGTAMLEMLASNLSPLAPLDLFVAWGGICFIALWVALGSDGTKRDTLLPSITVFLLLFPLPLATDVHRAWFELLAPTVLFFLLPQLTRERRPCVYPALALALAASIIPYATRFVAGDHLYLLILQDRLTPGPLLGLALALGAAATALYYWVRGGRGSSAAEPGGPKLAGVRKKWAPSQAATRPPTAPEARMTAP